MSSPLTAAQYQALLAPLDPGRVREKQGQSHLEAWDVRRWLNRIFGFGGWSLTTLELTCVREIEYPPGTTTVGSGNNAKKNPRTIWTVVYRAQVRLTVKAPDGAVLSTWDDGASGDAVNQPSLGDAHDHAMKTALSQAVKRCAVNLGDTFGLGLYNKARRQRSGEPVPAVVMGTLVWPEGLEDRTPEPSEDAPVVAGDLDDPGQVDPGEVPVEDVSQDPADHRPVPQQAPRAQQQRPAAAQPAPTQGLQPIRLEHLNPENRAWVEKAVARVLASTDSESIRAGWRKVLGEGGGPLLWTVVGPLLPEGLAEMTDRLGLTPQVWTLAALMETAVGHINAQHLSLKDGLAQYSTPTGAAQ